MYCTGIGPLACCWGGCRWTPALPRRGSSWRRRQKIFEVAAEEANLVVSEGIWVENADFGTHLLLRDLVERSILVYGKWGQFGRFNGTSDTFWTSSCHYSPCSVRLGKATGERPLRLVVAQPLATHTSSLLIYLR